MGQRPPHIAGGSRSGCDANELPQPPRLRRQGRPSSAPGHQPRHHRRRPPGPLTAAIAGGRAPASQDDVGVGAAEPERGQPPARRGCPGPRPADRPRSPAAPRPKPSPPAKDGRIHVQTVAGTMPAGPIAVTILMIRPRRPRPLLGKSVAWKSRCNREIRVRLALSGIVPNCRFPLSASDNVYLGCV